MLYSEFLKGTRAPETPDTYDQFQIIERIYTDCEGMTRYLPCGTQKPWRTFWEAFLSSMTNWTTLRG